MGVLKIVFHALVAWSSVDQWFRYSKVSALGFLLPAWTLGFWVLILPLGSLEPVWPLVSGEFLTFGKA